MSPQPFVQVASQPIYFEEDWETGIGGGLWSTGAALARYFDTPHALEQVSRILRAAPSSTATATLLPPSSSCSFLELGSGNGLLSVCWMALYCASRSRTLSDNTPPSAKNMQTLVVVTDTVDHLPLIQKTLAANPHIGQHERTNGKLHVLVTEHLWGEFPVHNKNAKANQNETSHHPPPVRLDGSHKFDFIVGSDVAYRKELYDPLLRSIQQFAHDKTVILLGCTMADTTPSFFDKLREAGFSYRRLADHLMPPGFIGQQTFGIFIAQRAMVTTY